MPYVSLTIRTMHGDITTRHLGARSLAFPAISTGIYGYPAAAAAEVAVATLRSAATRVGLVYLVAFDEAKKRLYDQLLV